MNFIRFHDVPVVPNNGDRQEIMESPTGNLFKKFELHDFGVIGVREQTIISCQALRFWFPTAGTI